MMTDQEILRLIEETRKFTVEQHKLIAETMAEQHKLIAEASKFKIERWLAPVIIVAGSLGSFTASFAAVRALLRW
jgi:hypothetical protein